MAPAKTPRLAKWVRFGAAPATSAAPSMPFSSRNASLPPGPRGEVAPRAGGAEQLHARLGLVAGGHRGALELVGLPVVVVGLGEGDDPHAHVGVGEAAELGALAAEHAGLVGLDQQRVTARPGTASRLPLRAGIQNEWMTSCDWMVSATGVPAGITRSLAVTMSSLAVAVDVVLVLPPPLLADDGDLHGVGRLLLEVEEGEHRGDADAGEQEGREDRPADLELEVAVELRRQAVVVVLALAEPPGEEEDAALHEHEHDAGDQEHRAERGRRSSGPAGPSARACRAARRRRRRRATSASGTSSAARQRRGSGSARDRSSTLFLGDRGGGDGLGALGREGRVAGGLVALRVVLRLLLGVLLRGAPR